MSSKIINPAIESSMNHILGRYFNKNAKYLQNYATDVKVEPVYRDKKEEEEKEGENKR